MRSRRHRHLPRLEDRPARRPRHLPLRRARASSRSASRAVRPAPPRAGLITRRVLDLVPHRPRDGSKFKSGVVVIAGGSRGLTGAPTMVALAAQRTGAGYVQVAVPESAEQALELRLLEAMTKGMPEQGRHAHGAGSRAGRGRRRSAPARWCSAPGSDAATARRRSPASSRRRPTSRSSSTPTASQRPHRCARTARRPRGAPTVLTLHAGELARLLDTDSSEIEKPRFDHAREAAERSRCVGRAEGRRHDRRAPGERPIAISSVATSALATAGTGDVLSGVDRRAPVQGPRRLRRRPPPVSSPTRRQGRSTRRTT